MNQRKNQPGYVRVPLKRSDRHGGTTIAHYWMRDGQRDADGVRDAVRDLSVDLDELDAEDILAQEVIYAFEGEKPTWHSPADGFAPDRLAAKYGDRFRDADIIHVAGATRDFYCLAAHGTASLLNALDKEMLSDWGDDPADVEQVTALLFGFTDWSKLRRHGIVPVDQRAGDAALLPSITVNGQAPIRDGAVRFAPGDVIERSSLPAEEIAAALEMWETTGVATGSLSAAVHEYAGAVPTTRLHRATFFPDRTQWEAALSGLQPGGDWGLDGDVTDFYADRYHSLAEGSDNNGDWIIRFEVFGLDGVPTAQLAQICGENAGRVRHGEWLVPGPRTTGVLRVDVDESDNSGSAVVYLLAD